MGTVSLQSINRVVRDIYAGVGNGANLERAIKRIRQLVNGSSAMLFSPTLAPDEGAVGFVDQLDIGFYSRYVSEICERDIWLYEARRKALVRNGNTFTNEQLIADEVFKNLPIYHEAHVPMEATRVVCGVVVGESDADLPPTLLSVFRGPRSAPYGNDDCRVLELLTPHLEQALRLERRLEKANLMSSMSLTLLDKLGCGVVVLDSNRHIRYINRNAEQLCVRERGFFFCSGNALRQCSLSAIDRRYDVQLQKAITQALCVLDRSRDQSLARCPQPLLMRSPSAETIVVRAIPVSAGHQLLEMNSHRAIVLIELPDHSVFIDDEVLASLLGLTPAESRIAAGLLRGEPPKLIAARLGVSENTVRTHVKALHLKTGVRGQAALIATLARLAGTLPVKTGVMTNDQAGRTGPPP